jgi:hypothetical protein
MGDYTLAQAQADVAALRGQLAHLAANSELLNLIIDTKLTLPDGSTWTAAGLSVAAPATAPVIADTWHTLGTLSHYTVTAGRFRFTPEGEVEFDVGVNGDGSNVVTTTFSVTIPSAYRPSVTRRVTMSQTGRTITAGDNWPALIVNTTGTVQVQCPAAGATTAMHCNVSFPLDN